MLFLSSLLKIVAQSISSEGTKEVTQYPLWEK